MKKTLIFSRSCSLCFSFCRLTPGMSGLPLRRT